MCKPKWQLVHWVCSKLNAVLATAAALELNALELDKGKLLALDTATAELDKTDNDDETILAPDDDKAPDEAKELDCKLPLEAAPTEEVLD